MPVWRPYHLPPMLVTTTRPTSSFVGRVTKLPISDRVSDSSMFSRRHWSGCEDLYSRVDASRACLCYRHVVLFSKLTHLLVIVGQRKPFEAIAIFRISQYFGIFRFHLPTISDSSTRRCTALSRHDMCTCLQYQRCVYPLKFLDLGI